MKITKIIIPIFLFLYVLFAGTIFFMQKNIIFLPSDNNFWQPESEKFEEVFFTTADGVTLHGYFLDNNAEDTALFFHGNAGNISYHKTQFQVFDNLELNGFIFDYREFGKSGGKIKKEENIYSDAEAALEFLKTEKNIKHENIIFWGRSLGGAVAVEMATREKAKALIVESSFSSVKEMAKENFWFLPVELLLRFQFDSLEKIADIKTPLLIIHSAEDEMISYKYGKKLFEAANAPKTFVEISGDHNRGFIHSQKKYQTSIRDFLQNL